MYFERIKHIKENIFFKKIILALLAFVVFLYLKSFFTTGVYYDGIFLKKDTISNETHYVGKSKQGAINITVDGWANYRIESTAEVTFNLPNNINEHYIVNFHNEEEWLVGNVEIKDKFDNIVFEGKYQNGSIFLYDLNNKPIIDGYSVLGVNGKDEVIYDSYYEIPYISIIKFALHETETIRGNGAMLFAATAVIFITFIDIKYPLFFFQLRHSFEVEDPKPNEFYISMQRLGWGINSVLALVLLVLAI